MDTKNSFYLGKIFDLSSRSVTEQILLYEPDDLTTHAVVVGMTGSGKTGLCIDLMEEAALNRLPALMIDPKGDITNALLHFPDLAPADFQPWVNPDEARREGKTIQQAAADTAEMWKKGLSDWGIGSDRIRELKNSVTFNIYTPGSDAGVPVSILASLKVPPIPWENNRELLREKISGTVTALLGLVGIQNIDPVRSREHILLANIFENAWSKGKDLDLGELILQTQKPPFPKLGIFDVNTFFPEKERFDLAMLLNNILAAPAFQTWIEGQPLDVQSLLYDEQGKPRHSIFYVAHLSDVERMFFITLLFSAVETWMRTQPGTGTLRSLLYFDEIFGYLPPLGNPPSKQPMLRMLKQARAFGVGLVLATQNPVDVDYKALSNAGSWFIGKLQTEQDKQRLLDGLQGAASGALDRAEYDRMLSNLGKRVFLLHNVHAKGPVLFQTRFAMNYLAGPLTRTQIPELLKLASTGPEFESTPAAGTQVGAAPIMQVNNVREEKPEEVGSATRPSLPSGIDEFFLPNNLTFTQAFKAAGRSMPGEAFSQGLLYRPSLLGQLSVRFLNRKYNLDSELMQTVLAPGSELRGLVRWENFQEEPVDSRSLDSEPDPRARFVPIEEPLADLKEMASLQKDLVDWAFRNVKATVRVNENLKLYTGPDVSAAEFRSMCAEAARKLRQEDLDKVESAFDKKLKALTDKLDREERELDEDETELSQRKMEEMGTHAENIFGLFGGRKSSRRISSSLSKRRMTAQAKADVDESKDVIKDLKAQIQALETEKAQALEEAANQWGEAANQVEEISVPALKKDVLVELFGVGWFPYHIVKVGEEIVELPGYGRVQS
ncbi:MAG: ATP-binding protein [Chloroflexi bacterium]|nr:MAG: ATP-binding protein [Chloroflexota bacterium]